MTGAMAEHEELAEIKPRLASVEEQVAGLPALVNVMLAEAESRIRVEVEAGFKEAIAQTYWKGFRHGLFTALGIGSVYLIMR